jgi:hypothetical protein
MSTPDKPSCFVVSPIGEPGSDTRKRSDKVLTHVFEAALAEEYKVTRADKISEPGMITSQILRALQDSDLVLADLTEHNANVFYELAVRHSVERPVIHVIDSHWKIPFDVAGFRTIVFDFTDLDSVAEAIKQLKQQATETRSGKQGETPIKVANITRPSKQDPQDTVLLKQAVEGIAVLRGDLLKLSDTVLMESERSRNELASRLAETRALLDRARREKDDTIKKLALAVNEAESARASAYGQLEELERRIRAANSAAHGDDPLRVRVGLEDNPKQS